jgi:hypothetical protein
MKLRIDSDVHVGVDAAWKSEIVPPVEHLFGVFRRNIWRKTHDLSVADCNVQTIDRSLFRTYNADIFYDEIKRFRHCRSSIAIAVAVARTAAPAASIDYSS